VFKVLLSLSNTIPNKPLMPSSHKNNQILNTSHQHLKGALNQQPKIDAAEPDDSTKPKPN
jgi:hypothetical protein